MATKEGYKCSICNWIFTQKSHLKTHIDGIHKNIKIDCKDCGKQYKRREHLKWHVHIVHKGIRQKCDICDKEFTTDQGMRKHKKAIHEYKTQLYPSKLCDHRSNNKGNLTKHIKALHVGVKYLCNICGLELSHPHSLKYHIQSQLEKSYCLNSF